MFWTRCIGRNVRQVNFSLLSGRQFDFGFLGSFFQALQSQHVFRQVDPAVFLELIDNVINDALIEILATQESIAIGRQNLKLFFAIDVGNFNDRNVESTAAQVINRNFAIAFFGFIHTESQCSCCRLIDDPLDFKTGNTTCIFGRLTLAIVEVGRNRDDCLGHFFTQIVFSRLFHFAQDIGRHLRRRQLLALCFNPRITVICLDDLVGHQVDIFLNRFFIILAANQALDGIQRIGRIGYRLALGGGTHQNFTVLHISHNRRRSARAFRVFNNVDLATIHDSNTAVGGSQVNTNNFAHNVSP